MLGSDEPLIVNVKQITILSNILDVFRDIGIESIGFNINHRKSLDIGSNIALYQALVTTEEYVLTFSRNTNLLILNILCITML